MSKLDTSAPITGPFPFEPFPKIARLRRDCVVTEKIDGKNASITIIDNGNGELKVFAASRNRWIDLEHDNAGFAAWSRSRTMTSRREAPNDRLRGRLR